MKNVATIFLLLICEISVGQKLDNIWVIGGAPAFGDADGYLDFSSGEPIGDSLINAVMPIAITNAGICDTTGNLLFYTNGIWVANRTNDTMLNGYGVTTGYGASYYEISGMGILGGALILPYPAHPNQFYLFDLSTDDSISYRPLRLTYSIIDMTLDSGLGAVIEKNISIIEDTLTLGRLTAVKHADGESWWLISHETKSNKYYRWLITAHSIYGPYSQKIGSKYGTGFTDVSGQSVFSEDGKKFATFGNNFKLDVMDFDRCTGVFSNATTFTFDSNIEFGIGIGCAFSPNGRFVYASSHRRLWQVDLLSDTPANEIDTVGFFDWYYAPFAAYFGLQQLAADNKIYMGAWNGDTVMHVIVSPDEKGAACNFTPHGLHLPVYNGSLPNLVNYELGPLKIYSADAGPDTTINPGDSVMIGSATVDSLKYSWSPISSLNYPHFSHPMAYPDTTTTYYLTIEDTAVISGCNSRVDSVTIFISYPTLSNQSLPFECGIQAQNILSLHEGSGVFKINSEQKVDIEIYNVFGQLLLHTSNYLNDWAPPAAGLYLYKIKCPSGGVIKSKLIAID